VFQDLVLATAQPTLTMTPEGTPQNVALRKGSTEHYEATKNVNPTCKPLSYID
jgi:hypothetical protein